MMASHTMQIVHEPSAFGTDSSQVTRNLSALKDQGIGGLVVNVSFRDYFENQDRWQEFLTLIRACRSLELRLWLYDEKGYPSGTAGGRVLRADPSLEAKGLCRDEQGRLIEDRAYEGTHASENYHERRRYINIVEPKATQTFLALTHEVYREKLQDQCWPVEAFFTDEPSLTVLNLGKVDPQFDATLPVHDAPDPNKKRLPMIAWSQDLARRFGRDGIQSVFSDSPDAAATKRQYYDAVGELAAESFFGQIRRWCRQHGTLSSGHLLWEEQLLAHPALYGNPLRCILELDIPGLDILTADPEAGVKTNLPAALLAASAGMLNGTRRILSETSDFAQMVADHRLGTVAELKAAAAWQAALGVTDFAWYYSWGGYRSIPHPLEDKFPPVEPRSPQEYREVNNFTNDLVDRLSPAALAPDIFLYYPIELVQQEFVPTEKMYRQAQYSPRLQQIRDAFADAMQQLVRSGILPCLVDGRMLASATADSHGNIHILKAQARAIVCPEGCRPPADLPVPAGITTFEMDDALPRQLFQAGQCRLLNHNPRVLVTALAAGNNLLITCVNLTNEPQTCEFSIKAKHESHTLGPYETLVLHRS